MSDVRMIKWLKHETPFHSLSYVPCMRPYANAVGRAFNNNSDSFSVSNFECDPNRSYPEIVIMRIMCALNACQLIFVEGYRKLRPLHNYGHFAAKRNFAACRKKTKSADARCIATNRGDKKKRKKKEL